MSESSWGRERDLRARPSPAFGAGDGGDDDGRDESGALERVDQLFSQAVERQVAEQRNLNRLLEDVEQQMGQVRNRIDELQKQVAREAGPTLDRLGALDAGLRSLRESVSAQSAALRTEVQEAIQALREEARDRASDSDERVAELRDADGRVASQLHDLAQRVEGTLERIDARQGALSEDIAGLRTALGDANDGSPVSPALSTLHDAVSELRTQVQQDLGAMRSRLDHVALEVDKPAQTVATTLRTLQAQLLEELETIRTSFDARSRLIGESTDSVGDELTQVLAQVRADVDERLDRQQREVREALQGHRVAVEEQAGTVRAASATLLEEVRERMSAVEQGVAARVASLDELLIERLAEHRSELQQLQLDQRAGLREQLEVQAAAQSAQLDRATEHFRGAAAALTVELDELEALSAQLAQNRAHEAEEREQLRERLTADLGAQLAEGTDAAAARVDAELARVRARLDDGFSGLRDRVETLEQGQDTFLERIDVIDGELSQQGEHVSRIAETMGGLTEDVSATFEGLQTELLAAQREVLDEFAASQDEAESRLVRARELLDRSASHVEDRADALEDQLAASLDRVAERLRLEAEEANAELRVAASRLDTTFQHLRHLESSLVAYLEARDRRLEHDRAALLRAVLGDLTEGLSKRERRRVTSNVERAMASLPATTPPAAGSATPTPREALTDLLGDEFAPPAPVDGETGPEDEPEIVPVPSRQRSAGDSKDAGTSRRRAGTPRANGSVTRPVRPTAAGTDGHVCPDCGFVAKSAGGLGSHQRTHR